MRAVRPWFGAVTLFTIGVLALCRTVNVARAADPVASGRPLVDRTEWDRLAAIDAVACKNGLARAHVHFRALPERTEPDERGCGIPHGVVVKVGPTGILYSPPLVVDCTLALELPTIERVLQEQARKHLGVPIGGVRTYGTYACRSVRGSVGGRMSEHAVGNAIDIASFIPESGAAIAVGRDYRLDRPPSSARSRFLRGVFWGLRAERRIPHVIGPEDRADHRDHFHVGLGEPLLSDRLIGG